MTAWKEINAAFARKWYTADLSPGDLEALLERYRCEAINTEPVVLPKPHLALGNEYQYADASQYDQCGAAPALPYAREAYDRIRKIETPFGWTGHACWSVSGEVAIQLRGPKKFLRTATFTGSTGEVFHSDIYENEEATFYLSHESGLRATGRQSNVSRPGANALITIDGIEARSVLIEFSTNHRCVLPACLEHIDVSVEIKL